MERKGLSYNRSIKLPFHKIIPYDIDKEIIEDRILGVGVLEAAFYISTAIIIHGILS